jgi:uncharacterized lipoprotein YddW (UPF0748 family)
MNNTYLRLGLVLGILFMLSGCATTKSIVGPSPDVPSAEREFRAAWVATVSNIDWPSKPGLSTEEQQKEVRTILDTAVALRLNAIVFQARPQCDALYQSALEPWSYYLTGVQGKAPDPFYDPLKFWVEEAHLRGIELHVWFNPYRAHLKVGGEITDSSLVKKRPDLAKKVPGDLYWLDPGKKETQDHSFNVVLDVVKRYDIDGIHFDDYFYPYGDGSFPDDESWGEYTKNGGSLTREDWRRSNVNAFIERVYKGIKSEKPYVKFGLSPFGIWRPTFPPSISGFDQYAALYADARLWLNEGWIDYWTPQLYWPINQIPQSYPVLLGWWVKENTKARNIWPGLFTSRMTDEKGTDENINEIMVTRGFVPEGPGNVHFSMKAFLRDSTALNAGLKNGPYRRQALVPPSKWLDDKAPVAPSVDTISVNDTLQIIWKHEQPDDVFRWVVYYQYEKNWEYRILNKNDRTTSIPVSRIVKQPQRARRGEEKPPLEITERLLRIAVSGVDRVGNESELVYRNVVPVAVVVTK